MPEAMQEGVEYANPWNPEETAEALKRVLSSPSYRSELKMKALARAQTLLRWDVRAATVVDFCRTIASRKKVPPANVQLPKAHAQ
jgi:glycosyltransferase involved in cell wall biosynthesis